ncbi:MAG: Sporulation domain protein [Magnetococcales bacterium]|nr:Sporulation domain protein [Magnetococcales bacterium]HIJ84146.1 hypothetical protein [Magnetococcales bacterium]
MSLTHIFSLLLMSIMFSVVGLANFAFGLEKGPLRQPAYISNAYFSDKMVEQGDVVQPTSVVKALKPRSRGVAGYFILDLVLTSSGSHHFKVNIINHKGDKVTDLDFPPVQARQDDTLPLYTAAGGLSGAFFPGLWFFKVFDQLDGGEWDHLGTFSIMMIGPDAEKKEGDGEKGGGKEAQALQPKPL